MSRSTFASTVIPAPGFIVLALDQPTNAATYVSVSINSLNTTDLLALRHNAFVDRSAEGFDVTTISFDQSA